MYGLSSAMYGLSSVKYGLSSAMYGKMSAMYEWAGSDDKNPPAHTLTPAVIFVVGQVRKSRQILSSAMYGRSDRIRRRRFQREAPSKP